ncbi:MAG: hypothetical protein WKG00_13900 [Polyangiaceae bacterium]
MRLAHALVLLAAVVGCGSSGDDDTAASSAASSSSGGSTGGAGGGGGGGSDACEASAAPDVPDVTGKWAYYEVTSRLVVIPGFADPFHTAVVSLLLVDQTQQGSEVTFAAEYCDHYSEDPDLVVHVVIPEAYTAALPPFTRTGSYTKDGEAWRYSLSKHWQVEGAMLDDIATDPLPTTPDDAQVVDQDADGKPAMTLRLTGLVDGEIYVVQRGWTEALGGPQAADELRGAVTFESEQIIVQSDPDNLKELATQATTDATPCASYFRMKRVADDADCALLKESFATLFP